MAKKEKTTIELEGQIKLDSKDAENKLFAISKKEIIIPTKLDINGLKTQLAKVSEQKNLNDTKVKVEAKLDLTKFREALNNIPNTKALNNKKITVEAKLDLSKLKNSIKDINKTVLNVPIDQKNLFEVEKRLAIIKNQIKGINNMTLNIKTSVSGGKDNSTSSSASGKNRKQKGSSDVDDKYQSLRARRKEALDKAEKVWVNSNGNSKAPAYLKARKQFIEANKEYVEFAQKTGKTGLSSLIKEYENMMGSYVGKTNPLRREIERMWKEAIKRQDELAKELASKNPVKQQAKVIADNVKNKFTLEKESRQGSAVSDAIANLKQGINAGLPTNKVQRLRDELRKATEQYLEFRKQALNFDKNAEAKLLGNIAGKVSFDSSALDDLIKKAQAAKQEYKSLQDQIKGTTPSSPNNGRGGNGNANTAQTFAAEAKRYAAEAEKAWRDAGNRSTPEFEKLRKQFMDTMNQMVRFRREIGDLSAGQAAGVYSKMASSLGKLSPLYDGLIKKARELNKEQARVNQEAKGDRSGGRWFGNISTGIIHYLGRSSKGFGSWGEATADVLAKGANMGGAIGRLSAVASGVGAAIAVFSAGVTVVAKGFTTVGDAAMSLFNVIRNIATTIYNVLRPGIELYKQQQSALFSFDAALRSKALVDGKSLAEQPEVSRGISSDLIKRATIDAEMSAFSLEELLRSLQGTLPMLLSKGMNLDQAYEVNKGVAGVAKMTQLTPSQILQETRDLAQGSITSRGSQVANALGITNDELKKFQGDSDKIFEYLMGRFKEYSGLLNEFEDTALGRWQQLSERWQTVTRTLVDAIAPQFKGLFETLIDMTGKYVDDSGRYLDAMTGKWMNADGTEFSGTFSELNNPHFQLSPEMEKVRDILVEILDLSAQAIDNIIQFAEETWGTEDPLNTAKDLISAIITAFQVAVNICISLAHALSESGPILTAMLNLGVIIVAVFYELYTVCSVIMDLLGGVISLAAMAYHYITGDEKAARNEAEWQLKTAQAAQKKFTEAPNLKYYDSIDDFLKDLSASDPNGYKEIEKAFNKWKGTDVTKAGKGNSSGYGFGDVKGVKSSQEDEKARKKAIKDAQKAMKEHIQGLKEQLKDHIAELKEALAKSKLAFDQGFMTIRDYYMQKAQTEAEEARLRLEEAQAEKKAILSTPYENQADQLKALHAVEREIRANTRALNKGIKAQEEVARNSVKMNRAMDIIANTSMNPNITELTPLQNGYQTIGANVGNVQLQMEGWASKNGIEPWIADQVLNEAQKYGSEWTDKYAKLALAMMMQESGGNQKALSGAGAIGLMQLMPDTASSLGVNPWDWKQNIAGGLKYIDQLKNTFGWDLNKIIAGYNAGPDAVKKYGGVPPYKETQKHVGIVSDYYDEIDKFAVSASNASKQLDNVANSASNASALFEGAKDVKLGENNKILGYIPIDKYSRGGIDTRYSDFEEYGMSGGVDHQIAGLQKSSIYAINALARAYWERTSEKIKWTSFTGDRTGGYNPHEKTPNGHFYGWKADAKASAHAILIELMNALQIGGSWENHHFDISFGKGNAYYNPNEMTNTRTGTGWLNAFNASKSFVGSGQNMQDKILQNMSDVNKAYNDNVEKLLSGNATELIETIKKAVPDESDTGNSMFNEALQQLTTLADLVSEAGSRITGNVTAGFQRIVIDFYKNIVNAKKDPRLIKLYSEQFVAKALDYRKQAAMEIFDFSLDTFKRRGEVMGNQILMGRYNFNEMLRKYVDQIIKETGSTDPNALFRPANPIKQLEALYREYESRGELKTAVEIRNAMDKAYQTLQDVIKGWIDKGTEYIDKQQAIFEAGNFTNLQKEFGNREIQAYRAEYEFNRRTEISDVMSKRLSDITNTINSLELQKKNLLDIQTDIYEKLIAQNSLEQDTTKTLEEQNKNKKELASIQSDIDRLKLNENDLEVQKRLNELERERLRLLKEQPNYLRDLRNTAKQALEDGLVTFLTDGVNEAENLGEALRNLSITFLKEIQQMSAKWMIKSLMNKWFGQFIFKSPEEITSNNTSALLAQEMQQTELQSQIVSLLSGKVSTPNSVGSAGVGGGTAPGAIATGTVYSGTTIPTLTSPVFGEIKKSYELPALANSPFGSNNQKIDFNGMQLSQDSLNQFNQKLQESSNTALPGFSEGLDQAIEGFGEMDLSNAISPNVEGLANALQTSTITIETSAQQQGNIIQSTVVPALEQLATSAKNAGTALATMGVGGSGHAEGGLIKGPGTSTSDSIPAMLSNGEYVVKASSVRKYGTNFLNAVNSGSFTKIKSGVQHFAKGGLVENVARSEINEGMQGFANQQNNNQPINNTAHINVALVRDEAEGFRQLLKSPEGQRIMLDFSRKYASVTSRF